MVTATTISMSVKPKFRGPWDLWDLRDLRDLRDLEELWGGGFSETVLARTLIWGCLGVFIVNLARLLGLFGAETIML